MSDPLDVEPADVLDEQLVAEVRQIVAKPRKLKLSLPLLPSDNDLMCSQDAAPWYADWRVGDFFRLRKTVVDTGRSFPKGSYACVKAIDTEVPFIAADFVKDGFDAVLTGTRIRLSFIDQLGGHKVDKIQTSLWATAELAAKLTKVKDEMILLALSAVEF